MIRFVHKQYVTCLLHRISLLPLLLLCFVWAATSLFGFQSVLLLLLLLQGLTQVVLPLSKLFSSITPPKHGILLWNTKYSDCFFCEKVGCSVRTAAVTITSKLRNYIRVQYCCIEHGPLGFFFVQGTAHCCCCCAPPCNARFAYLASPFAAASNNVRMSYVSCVSISSHGIQSTEYEVRVYRMI